MKAGIITQSAQVPDPIKITKLMNGATEFFASDNVQAATVTDTESGETVERTEYTYKAYSATLTVDSYDDTVAALVGLKYSYADEIALMRKGNADSSNEEYTAYLEYVEDCKAYARVFCGISEEG